MQGIFSQQQLKEERTGVLSDNSVSHKAQLNLTSLDSYTYAHISQYLSLHDTARFSEIDKQSNLKLQSAKMKLSPHQLIQYILALPTWGHASKVHSMIDYYQKTDAYKSLEKKTDKTPVECLLYLLVTDDISKISNEDMDKYKDLSKIEIYPELTSNGKKILESIVKAISAAKTNKKCLSEDLCSLRSSIYESIYRPQNLQGLIYWLGLNFQGFNFQKADLSDLELTGANFGKANLQEANLEDSDLQFTNFRSADLQKANLWGASLAGANLQQACLHEADLMDTYLADADFRKADLQGANLQKARVSFDTDGTANFQQANLQGVNFQEAALWESDFKEADARGANFHKANLRGANFRGADLRSVDFREADLRGAMLNGANLEGANLEGANLRGAKLDGNSFLLGKVAENFLVVFGIAFNFNRKWNIQQTRALSMLTEDNIKNDHCRFVKSLRIQFQMYLNFKEEKDAQVLDLPDDIQHRYSEAAKNFLMEDVSLKFEMLEIIYTHIERLAGECLNCKGGAFELKQEKIKALLQLQKEIINNPAKTLCEMVEKVKKSYPALTAGVFSKVKASLNLLIKKEEKFLDLDIYQRTTIFKDVLLNKNAVSSHIPIPVSSASQ